MTDREKLIELIAECHIPVIAKSGRIMAHYAVQGDEAKHLADHLIANGVTVQKWIPVAEPPKENGYYLCVLCVSAVNQRKEYRRVILFWEDNVWIDMANSFRTRKPLYWMPLPELPKS